ELESLLVRDDDVVSRFEWIAKRSKPGSYPGLGWMEEEGERLGSARDHATAWVLMTPQNFSVPREAFHRVGGFDETLGFSEGWDLFLRLRANGVPVVRLGSARIYHL